MATQTVFVQFTYCPLCRLNHKKGRKHAFSKKHQEIVVNILKKFEKKVTEAKRCLSEPMVETVLWEEQAAMFWCYFCQMDVARHSRKCTVHGDCITVNGGMLEHLTRTDHSESVVKFLRENMQNVKRTQEFTLSSKDYLKYLEDSEKVCTAFLNERAAQIRQEASRIRCEDLMRRQVVSSVLRDQTRADPSRSETVVGKDTDQVREWMLPVAEIERKKTARAFGDGLTAVDRSQEDDSLGNIFSNAPPPWLMAEPTQETLTHGSKPDMADLEKHKKLVQKSKLPAKRVGAKFDHKQSQSSETWLPNFGGVWYHGRRSKAGEHFQRRTSWKGKGPAATKGVDLKQQVVNDSQNNILGLTTKQQTQRDTSYSKTAKNVTETLVPLNSGSLMREAQEGFNSRLMDNRLSIAPFTTTVTVSAQGKNEDVHNISSASDGRDWTHPFTSSSTYNYSNFIHNHLSNSMRKSSTDNTYSEASNVQYAAFHPTHHSSSIQYVGSRPTFGSSHHSASTQYAGSHPTHHSSSTQNASPHPTFDPTHYSSSTVHAGSHPTFDQTHLSSSTQNAIPHPTFDPTHHSASTHDLSNAAIPVRPYTRKRKIPQDNSAYNFQFKQFPDPVRPSSPSSSVSSWSSHSLSTCMTSSSIPLRLLSTPVLNNQQQHSAHRKAKST